MKKLYTPPQKILENYAKVLIDYALGGGKGIKKGDVVRVVISESAKPLFVEIRRAIIRSGGHIITSYLPDNDDRYNLSRDFYELASNEQLDFYPKKYLDGMIAEMDHQLFIISDTDKKALAGVDPQKMMRAGKAMRPFMEDRTKKESEGRFTWTLGIYGTPAMAKEVGMTEKEYWNQIIKACFLDHPNPIATWKKVSRDVHKYCEKLNKLQIEDVHLVGPDVDVTIKIGEKRKWVGGSGRNIPSFEIFTSPDWRGTNGWMRFNQPLYRYGNVIEGIQLWFKDGRVIKSSATKNEKVLKAMIATEGADKLGEFSMTDSRFSRITKFMGETLYDENVGGKYGNSHVAVGNSYHDCYMGDPSKVSKQEWERLGYNSSSVHTDIVSTANRTITATLKNGKKKVIYKDGKFTI